MGGLIDALPGIFGNMAKWKDPSEAANKYYQPYIDAGKEALGQTHDEYGRLINDPSAKLKSIGQGYTQDPGYQYELQQGQTAANNAEAAGGMAGTPQHMQMASDMAGNTANKYYQQYLSNAMKMYQMGLGGQSDISKMGYDASSNAAQNTMGGQQQKNQHEQEWWGNVANSVQGFTGNPGEAAQAAQMFF